MKKIPCTFFRLQPYLLTCLFLILLAGCRKNDYKNTDNTKESIEIEKFFKLPEHASHSLEAIVADLKKREEKHHFLNRYIAKNGYPLWGKAVSNLPVLMDNNGKQSNEEGQSGVFFVPLQNEGNPAVSAYLVVYKINDSTIRYKSFNRSYIESANVQSDSTRQNAANLLSVFGYFEKEINNVPVFSVNAPYNLAYSDVDMHIGEIPGGRTSVTSITFPSCRRVFEADITITYPDGSTESGTYLVIINDCYEPGDNFPPPGNDGGPANWGTGFGGAIGSGGAAGGTGGTGTGGNGYYWDENCQCTALDPWWTGNNTSISPEETWFNSLPLYTLDLSGLSADPCAAEIARDVTALTNSTIKTIKDVFNESSKYHLKFAIAPNMGVAGRTSTAPGYLPINGQYGKLSYINTEIKLDDHHLATATKLAIAETIIHEMIHAYFHYRSIEANGDPVKEQQLSEELGFLKPYDPNASESTYGSAHEQMAATFIDKIAAALKEYKLITPQDLQQIQAYYPTVDVDTYYKAMAWAGLAGSVNGSVTKAWQTLETNNPAQAQMYSLIISAEENAGPLAACKEKC